MEVNYIKASDYTHLFVDHSVLMMMEEDIIGKTIMDFEDVNLMDRDISILAEMVIKHDLEIMGIDNESTQLLESHIRKLSTPDFESIDEFEVMFEAKYPKGTLCIWDKSLSEDILPNENKLSLVMLESIDRNYVNFRLYRSHLMEPKFIHMYGGMDSKELYTIESVHVTEFINKRVMFRHPKDEKEEMIITMFMEI